MLSYMLPTDDKPPPDSRRNGNLGKEQSLLRNVSGGYRINDLHHNHHNHHHHHHHHHHINQQHDAAGSAAGSPNKMTLNVRVAAANVANSNANLQTPQFFHQRGNCPGGGQAIDDIDETDEVDEPVLQRNGGIPESPVRHVSAITTKKSSSSTSAFSNNQGHNPPHGRTVVKDDSLYSIGSDASTVGSEKKQKLFNGAKHTSLKRVSFGSSKGSMVETLVYETPVQEEPENNHFSEHNGRLPAPITFGSPLLLAPDTDEGRERVRVSLLAPTPCPSTPGVLLLESASADLDEHLSQNRAMATSPVELLTTHTEHTTPTYHTQISTDSGWDNPFRPDGDLSREADEIVELIKGGKPITPTPGQNAPPLPGSDVSSTTPLTSSLGNQTANQIANGDLESKTSPLLQNSNQGANQNNSSPRLNHGNGNATHVTPNKNSGNGGTTGQTTLNNAHEKVATSVNAATVEVGRVTAQGPGDASQVEHVTLKKKPKCKCCVLQ